MAEPLPPPGVDQDLLYAAIIAALGPNVGQAWLEWHETAWPRWARQEARGREAAHKACPKPSG